MGRINVQIAARGLGEWLSGTSVLLIEDNAMVLRALRTAFEYRGCAVETATTAEEGLAILSDKVHDVIICDYHLPGMNGVGFFEETRAYTHRSARILISAFGFSDLNRHSLKGDIDLFLEKPFSIKTLFKQVAAITEQRDQGAPPTD